MRTAPPFWQSLRVASAAALVLSFMAACKPSVNPAAPAKRGAASPNSAAPGTNGAAAEYASVFEELMPPRGRDPFFPNSRRRYPVSTAVVTPMGKPLPAFELVLKGIVRSANRRLAVISGDPNNPNDAILEIGEEGSVQVPGGHKKVRCMEVGEDYAVIQVDGELQPKRIVLNKKGF